MNRAITGLFDLVLTPFELLGDQMSLILVSGVFGILALIVFKYVSFQKAIKAAKDKIKGHMIEIRLYQDDLVVVAKAFTKVIVRNTQYLVLNFTSILPLLIPFVLIMAQMVVRYAFAPIPVTEPTPEFLPGQGTTVKVELVAEHRDLVNGLSIEYPDTVRPTSPLVRSSDGKAWQEFVAVSSGDHELTLVLADGTRETKRLATGDEPGRHMQPERGSSIWSAILWPAEPTFASDSPFAKVQFVYPDRDLGWLPGGPFGVVIVFFLASMLFGVLVLKPLKIQI